MISGDPDNKIFYLHTINDTTKLSTFLKKYKNIILIGGCFDLLHYGQITFLRKAKAHKGALIVLLESDETVLRKKKRKPIHPQEKRAQLLASVSYVDGVIAIPYLTSDKQYEKLTKIIHPRIIAVTKGDRLLANKKNQAKLIKAKVRTVTPHIAGLSTSLITNYATISGN